ncbi:MAG TPA: RagB/SusD family nutrient uptake outer membrane protein [Mucilaginibacter sp.]|jgi:hypothetical protein|nr:RagB/SusD family nutrient uptake outer membrane protein [Mucilaginibacter sp.]
MKRFKIKLLPALALVMLVVLGTLNGCKKNLLTETPLSSLSVSQVLSTRAGFTTFMTALHVAARNELISTDTYDRAFDMQTGTDVATTGDPTITPYVNYTTYLTPVNNTVKFYWDWAYLQMIARANNIIVYANKADPSIWASAADKNAVIAEAKFFRAYTYNVLTNLYGDVPIVDTIYDTPKVDFTRNTRQQVLTFAKNDLIFASKYLPTTVAKTDEGHIVKGAADHLLAEVYISLGDYDNAIASANNVINSGLYHLMTTRFGSDAANPGDPYSDLFKDGNQNRSSGNFETLYVLQIEDVTPGGQGDGVGANATAGTANNWIRAWGPRYFAITDPKGVTGMIVCDSLGRGVGWVRPCNYVEYDIWRSDYNTDIRNSKYNMRRQFIYNNPASTYYGQLIGPRTADIDTMQYLYAYPRKIEGKVGKVTNNTAGKTFKDMVVYRLAETYLLRAEAYLRKNDLVNAAADINIVRSRAHASPVDPSNVTIDYLLDERARELLVEEPRRRTLSRMGKLVERVRKYNIRATTRSSIQDYHALFPIPQSAIDANFGAKLGQNPGYPQ